MRNISYANNKKKMNWLLLIKSQNCKNNKKYPDIYTHKLTNRSKLTKTIKKTMELFNPTHPTHLLCNMLAEIRVIMLAEIRVIKVNT